MVEVTQHEFCVLLIENDVTSTLFTKIAPQSLSHQLWSLAAVKPTRSIMKLQTSVLTRWPAMDVSECSSVDPVLRQAFPT